MSGPTALVTLAETRLHLNLAPGDTWNDTELQGFIDDAAPVIEDIVGPVIQVTFDEWYDGNGPVLALRHRPVVSITSVTEYVGASTYPLSQVATPDLGSVYSYSFETSGRLIRRSSGGAIRAFPPGFGNIHVVYVAGRATVPPNVKLATLELVRHLFQLSQQGGRPQFGGGALEEGPWAPSGFAVPTRVIELLAPNRRYPSIA